MDNRIQTIVAQLSRCIPPVRRTDLARASDILHIRRAYGTFAQFCAIHGLRTSHAARIDGNANIGLLVSTITELAHALCRPPTSREVKAHLRATCGRASLKCGLTYNELLDLAGSEVRRKVNVDSHAVVAALAAYRDSNGFLPYASDLKTAVGIAPNSGPIKAAGGYIAFVKQHGLHEYRRTGKVTTIPTTGHDGRLYASKAEALFANFLLTNAVDYVAQFEIGVFHHTTNQLSVDFLVTIRGNPDRIVAVEINGMGPLRRNTANMVEKRARVLYRKWLWLELTRDQVRRLNTACWEQLVSSAATS